ncbi:MAG: hypothetical protein KJ804_02850 [Proteobacteria bacterium]|nr:hypothetical protein [Pseudomonadota bacterium]
MSPNKLEAAKKLLREGMPPKDVPDKLEVSIPTLNRWCLVSSENGNFSDFFGYIRVSQTGIMRKRPAGLG